MMNWNGSEIFTKYWSRNSSVDIQTGYALYGPDSIHGRAGFFSSTQSPDRFLGPPYQMGTGAYFPGGKAAVA
jgi:hypothetical protein